MATTGCGRRWEERWRSDPHREVRRGSKENFPFTFNPQARQARATPRRLWSVPGSHRYVDLLRLQTVADPLQRFHRLGHADKSADAGEGGQEFEPLRGAGWCEGVSGTGEAERFVYSRTWGDDVDHLFSNTREGGSCVCRQESNNHLKSSSSRDFTLKTENRDRVGQFLKKKQICGISKLGD